MKYCRPGCRRRHPTARPPDSSSAAGSSGARCFLAEFAYGLKVLPKRLPSHGAILILSVVKRGAAATERNFEGSHLQFR